MTNDPTAPVLRAVQTYQVRLFQLWKMVFKKINSKFSSAKGFFQNAFTRGVEIASKVGKSVVNTVVTVGQRVLAAVDTVPGLARQALRLGNKIIGLIMKAADPNKIIAQMKKHFVRYVRMLREIFAWVTDFLAALNPLGTALSVINGFKVVLRFVADWITDVGSAVGAVKKAKSLLKRVVKEMRKEVKEAILLRKQVLKLKPA
ncbi:MAG: hypothetical protein ACFBRM_00665 [Pikeienuella sp.]